MFSSTHRRLLAVSAVTAAFALAIAPGALAGQSEPGGGGAVGIPDPTGGSTTTGCKYYTWTTPPKLVIHLGEFEAGGGGGLNELLMVGEVGKAVGSFNGVGDTSAAVTKVETSTLPFSYDTWKGDGAIHLGFTSASKFAALLAEHHLPSNTDALTGTTSYGCGITEAHIVFPDPNSRVWTYSTPILGSWHDTYGARYYDAGSTTPGGDYSWFRPSFLHELEHAFGLSHTKTQYAYMNHRGDGGFPWANRPEADAIRPLPYDAQLLRARYPASGSRYDVAVLNTWYEPPADADDDAGFQTKLCSPSRGTAWSALTSDGTCGKNGATTVCAGDTLRTRYTLANYSTDSMTVWAWLYFSKDETFDGTDPASTTSSPSYDVGAAKSTYSEDTWTVPALTKGVKYHPIVRVIAEHIGPNGAEAPSVRADWIPLRGTVTGC